MSNKQLTRPPECAACGCTALSEFRGVLTCDHTYCSAAGRLECYLANGGWQWTLDGKKVNSIHNIYGIYTPADRDLTPNTDLDSDDFIGKWGEFSSNLCSKFLFPDEDNNDIEDRLQRAGVITTETDSEGGEMHVYFDTKEDATAFYSRLWTYLRKRWLAIHDLKKQLRDLL